MQTGVIGIVAAAVISALTGAHPAVARVAGLYEVTGVEKDDMLKMRAGPGIGYKIILGLPNGTELRVHSCEQSGGTRWCKVSLKNAGSVRGFVSWAYLRKL